MLHVSEEAGMEPTKQSRLIKHEIIEELERVWSKPDHGIWEDRGEARHYVSSKVMAWLAFDRVLAGSAGKEISRAEHKRLSDLRDHVHDVICKEGFNEGLGTFTSFFGGQTFDASLLLLPKVGFLPMGDERMAGTVETIERHLVFDGMVRRHQSNEVVPEGCFIACCFWLAECQLLAGRRDDAVRTIERTLSVSGNLGLLSEEYDVASKRLNGNFPQALSHLALIGAVLALDRYDRR
jgi:GH15 family glucan-1,4-alpha-glucosidase